MVVADAAGGDRWWVVSAGAHSVCRWDVQAGPESGTTMRTGGQALGVVNAVAIAAPSGAEPVVVGLGIGVRLWRWHAITGELLGEQPFDALGPLEWARGVGGRPPVTGVDLGDRSLVVNSLIDRRLQAWDPVTGALVGEPWVGHTDAVWSLTAGVRGNDVRFESLDHFVTDTNPDDSGRRTYRKTVPVAGLLWRAGDRVTVYANYGQGFETPTTTEIAYRNAGPGLNFDLNPAASTAYELGVKSLVASGQRLDVAVFATDTHDEIVVDAATNGRTTYKNAGDTRRRGVELEYSGTFAHGVRAHAALAYLDAKFSDALTTGSPPVLLPAGNKLPGVPDFTAYGELAWTPVALPWLELAAEVQSSGKIYVNERNSDAAPAAKTRSVPG